MNKNQDGKKITNWEHIMTQYCMNEWLKFIFQVILYGKQVRPTKSLSTVLKALGLGTLPWLATNRACLPRLSFFDPCLPWCCLQCSLRDKMLGLPHEPVTYIRAEIAICKSYLVISLLAESDCGIINKILTYMCIEVYHCRHRQVSSLTLSLCIRPYMCSHQQLPPCWQHISPLPPTASHCSFWIQKIPYKKRNSRLGLKGVKRLKCYCYSTSNTRNNLFNTSLKIF